MNAKDLYQMPLPGEIEAANDDVELGSNIQVSAEIRAIIERVHGGALDLVDAAVETYDNRRKAFCQKTTMRLEDFDSAMARGDFEALYNQYNNAVIAKATNEIERDEAFNGFERMFDDLTFVEFSGWWTTETKNQKRNEMLLASNQTPFEVSASTRERVLGAYGPANDDVGDNLAQAA